MSRIWFGSPRDGAAPGGREARGASTGLGLAVALTATLAGAVANAQAPDPLVPNLRERSGLVMRYAIDAPGKLPPDPHRDNFYGTRYADRGLVKHPDGVLDQGLYGMGWKAKYTQSEYPFFYGNPGQSSLTAAGRPSRAWRSARFIQGVLHPFKPVGSYYEEGSYVPIYDFDPGVPGPGPFPYPFHFNWCKGG